MSFESLLNRTCGIRRKTKTETRNEFGEEITTVVDVATDVRMRIERVSDRDTLEAYKAGDTVKGLFCIYMSISPTIKLRGNDIIFDITPPCEDMIGINEDDKEDTLMIVGKEDAGGQGQHLEIYAKFSQEIN